MVTEVRGMDGKVKRRKRRKISVSAEELQSSSLDKGRIASQQG